MTAHPPILLAEDDESDVLFLRRALAEAGVPNPLHVARDGQEAMDLLWQQRHAANDRLPALTLLDLKMPRRSGMEVLQWIRRQNVLRCLPVIVFSSSSRREDVERAYALGANAFLVKPASIVQRAEVGRFIKVWLQLNQPPLASTEGFSAAQAAHAVQAFDSLP